jgi:hypothetical protein
MPLVCICPNGTIDCYADDNRTMPNEVNDCYGIRPVSVRYPSELSRL